MPGETFLWCGCEIMELMMRHICKSFISFVKVFGVVLRYSHSYALRF
jgi:hypothetical protein